MKVKSKYDIFYAGYVDIIVCKWNFTQILVPNYDIYIYILKYDARMQDLQHLYKNAWNELLTDEWFCLRLNIYKNVYCRTFTTLIWSAGFKLINTSVHCILGVFSNYYTNCTWYSDKVLQHLQVHQLAITQVLKYEGKLSTSYRPYT